MKYTIEELYLIFKEHAKKYDKQQKEMVKNFKETCPDDDLPDHMKDNFNFALALQSICTAILNLQDHER